MAKTATVVCYTLLCALIVVVVLLKLKQASYDPGAAFSA